MSFKGKDSTGVAMTSGQAADGDSVTEGERVEGDMNPEQTADWCFRGGREKAYTHPSEMRD